MFTDREINASHVLQVNQHPGRSGLWTVESMLRSGDCAGVLAWPGCDTELMDKRLQKAAEQGRSLCVLFRYESLATHPSGVDVRLKVEVSEGGRAVTLAPSPAALHRSRSPGADRLVRSHAAQVFGEVQRRGEAAVRLLLQRDLQLDALRAQGPDLRLCVDRDSQSFSSFQRRVAPELA